MLEERDPDWLRPSIVTNGYGKPVKLSAILPPVSPQYHLDAVTDWDGPADAANPKNWSLKSRIYHTTLPALYGFSICLGTSIYSPGVPAIMDEFGVSLSVALLGLSLYSLGLALGPVIGAPISEIHGRKAVYLITLPIFLLFTAGAGLARNIQTLIVLRFLSGIFGSPSLAVGAGTAADIWDMEHGGGLASVLIVSTFFLGPSLGPLIGGYAIETSGDWRWLMWVLLLITGPVMIAVLPSKETSKKIILARRAKYLGVPGPPRPPIPTALKTLLVVTLGRPLKMLATEPIVTGISVYHGFVLGVLYAFFESYPYVFSHVYGFSSSQIGLAFLGISIDTCLAILTFAVVDKTVYQKKKAACAPEKPPPEERLYTSMLGAPGIPIALFWFGWTARQEVHPLIPIAAGIPFGWGVVTLFLGGITFLLDTYGANYGASAIAANGILRFLSGAAFPLFTFYIHERLGIAWASSLFAFIGLVLLLIPFILYHSGPSLLKVNYVKESLHVLYKIKGIKGTVITVCVYIKVFPPFVTM